jgi:hypothetical protein
MVTLPRDVVECALAYEPQCEAMKLRETSAFTEYVTPNRFPELEVSGKTGTNTTKSRRKTTIRATQPAAPMKFSLRASDCYP